MSLTPSPYQSIEVKCGSRWCRERVGLHMWVSTGLFLPSYVSFIPMGGKSHISFMVFWTAQNPGLSRGKKM